MRIALDHDGTYTRDPILWMDFIASAIGRGHEVVCVTMRNEAEPVTGMPCEVVYTNRKSKVAHMARIERPIDIWIDDSPQWLMLDSIQASDG